MPRLQINTDLVRKILVLFLRDAVTKIGYERAILNLSGGIDSALVAYLIAEAVGPENVLAPRLPYKSSSQDSLDDAQAV
ncbi:MAG: NAD(+) synthetase, partial [Chloroflexi bacterium]